MTHQLDGLCATVRSAVLAVSLVALHAAAGAQQAEAVDMGQTMPDAKSVAEGLFPEDQCEQLKAAGFK